CLPKLRQQGLRGGIDRCVLVPALDLHIEAAHFPIDVKGIAGKGSGKRRCDAVELGLRVAKLQRPLKLADFPLRPAPALRKRRPGAQVTAQREQASTEVRDAWECARYTRIEMPGDR